MNPSDIVLYVALYVLGIATALGIWRWYGLPQVERIFNVRGGRLLAAISGMPPPPEDATLERTAAAASVHLRDVTRKAFREELPRFMEEFSPVFEEKVRAAIPDLASTVREAMPGLVQELAPVLEEKVRAAIPDLAGTVREAIPGLVQELAPIIGEALIRSGQEFFGEKGNIVRAAGKTALAQIPGAAPREIDIRALLESNPQIAAAAKEYGIDPSALPAKVSIPQGTTDPLSFIAGYIPALKPVLAAIKGIQSLKGLAGSAGSAGPSFAHGPFASSEGDKAFAERVLRR